MTESLEIENIVINDEPMIKEKVSKSRMATSRKW